MRLEQAPPRHTAARLAQFVTDYCDGLVWTADRVAAERGPDWLKCVFLPLAFGALRDIDIAQLGTIYAVVGRDKTLGIVNDMPRFFSCTLMHRDDWKRARVAIEAERARRETARNELVASLASPETEGQ